MNIIYEINKTIHKISIVVLIDLLLISEFNKGYILLRFTMIKYTFVYVYARISLIPLIYVHNITTLISKQQKKVM